MVYSRACFERKVCNLCFSYGLLSADVFAFFVYGACVWKIGEAVFGGFLVEVLKGILMHMWVWI